MPPGGRGAGGTKGGGGPIETPESWAVVTAGVHGLGRAIAERLAEAGLGVVATTRQADARAAAWAAQASALFQRPIRVARWDPADPASDDEVLEVLRGEGARTRVLVNNAGPFRRARQSLADVSLETMMLLWQGNVGGGVRLTQRLLPALRASRDGRIVNLGAVGAGAAGGWTGRGAYAAAKAALASLTRTWALEEAAHGVTANMVCPSDIHRQDKEARHPGETRPSGADVAAVVAFFAGDGARFVTGQVVELAFGDRPRLLPGEITESPAAALLPAGVHVRLAGDARDYEVLQARTEGASVEYLVRPPGAEPRWVPGAAVRRVVAERGRP